MTTCHSKLLQDDCGGWVGKGGENLHNYFSHDSNARNSDKLLKVRMKYAWEGYGLYFALLERLRDEDGYKSLKDYNVLAFELRVDASLIKSIVEDFGLFVFTEDGKYFYSEGFSKRMALKDKQTKQRSEASKKAAEKRWGKKGNADAMPTHNKGNASAIPNDAKEKKREVKKITQGPVGEGESLPNSLPLDETLLDFTDWWQVYPRHEKKQVASVKYNQARNSGATVKQLLDGAKNYAKFVKVQGKVGNHIAMADNWLDQERWTDEYETPEPRESMSAEEQKDAQKADSDRELAQRLAALAKAGEQT